MTKINDEMTKFVDLISGEKNLREKEMKIAEEKKKAIEEVKEKRRKGIVEKNLRLEEDTVPKKEIVQNIKLFSWKAPDRYAFNYNSKTFLIVVAISLFLILLLAILGHYFMMAAVISLLFFIYVAGTTKPIIIEHKITARGIDTGGKLYEWYMLEDFYFTTRGEVVSLLVDTKLNIPGMLILLIEKKDKDALFVLLQEKLLYKDIRKQGRLDKMSYGEYIPLEDV
ncbi:MAG: hypothetical protein AB9915_01695 [Candidatus Dojkabacteria bacterium]